MAPPPVNSVPTISPAEMQILVSRAGLVLNPGQVADLVLAWRQVAGLIASLPQDRPMADDLAYSFRLPPPAVTPAGQARATTRKPPARKAAPAQPKAKPAAPPESKAKAKASRTARPKAPARATRRR